MISINSSKFTGILGAVVISLVSACGGGGGDGGNSGFATNTSTNTNTKPQTSSEASVVASSTASNESKAGAAASTTASTEVKTSSAASRRPESSSSSDSLDTTPPSSPNSVVQVSVSVSQVDIGWTSATDNIAVTTYNIYRDTTLVGSVAGNILLFTDKTVQANKLYTYSVEAGDAVGNKSPAPKSILVTTPPEAIKGDATLYWGVPTQREDGSTITEAELGGFLIRYKLKTANDYTLIDINDSSVKSRVITNLTGDYEFQIAAYDANNLYSSFVNLSPH